MHGMKNAKLTSGTSVQGYASGAQYVTFGRPSILNQNLLQSHLSIITFQHNTLSMFVHLSCTWKRL